MTENIKIIVNLIGKMWVRGAATPHHIMTI
jgi:hypothetical protein